MRPRRLTRWLAILLSPGAFLLVAVLPGQPLTSKAESAGELRCTLETDRQEFRLGETVRLDLWLENRGERKLQVFYRAFEVETGIEFRDSTGVVVPRVPVRELAVASVAASDLTVLEPGARRRFAIQGQIVSAQRGPPGSMLLDFGGSTAFLLEEGGPFRASLNYAPDKWVPDHLKSAAWVGHLDCGFVDLQILPPDPD